jgi:hypothetical protein
MCNPTNFMCNPWNPVIPCIHPESKRGPLKGSATSNIPCTRSWYSTEYSQYSAVFRIFCSIPLSLRNNLRTFPLYNFSFLRVSVPVWSSIIGSVCQAMECSAAPPPPLPHPHRPSVLRKVKQLLDRKKQIDRSGATRQRLSASSRLLFAKTT